MMNARCLVSFCLLVVSMMSNRVRALEGYFLSGTNSDGYLLSICESDNGNFYWGLTQLGSIFQYIEGVGSGISKQTDSSDDNDQSSLHGNGYILGSYSYFSIDFTIVYNDDDDDNSLSLLLSNTMENFQNDLTFNMIDDNEAQSIFDSYNINWGEHSCMMPYSAQYDIGSDDTTNINDDLSGIWLTDAINDAASPFNGWTDLELFSANLNNEGESCWAYFDENGEWRIGGPFSDFTTINNENDNVKYYNELRLFLWKDFAVPESDACYLGSELQMRIDENTMLFTFYCSDEFVGGTSLIYKNNSDRFSDLQCPIYAN